MSVPICLSSYVARLPIDADSSEKTTLDSYLEAYFGGLYILNTMGASVVRPHADIYTANVHRDIRSFTHGFPCFSTP